jgi:hypothetical protein
MIDHVSVVVPSHDNKESDIGMIDSYIASIGGRPDDWARPRPLIDTCRPSSPPSFSTSRLPTLQLPHELTQAGSCMINDGSGRLVVAGKCSSFLLHLRG